MRRNYISPEFTYNLVNGTLNMTELSSFFGSKLMKLPLSIYIGNDTIIYYQLSTNEQLNLKSEMNYPPIIFNTITDKQNNQKIILDPNQTSTQLSGNTKWILTININQILIDYIFATLKSNRIFEGIQNSMSLYNNINLSINEYITNNIIPQYKYSSINLYISYNNLSGQNQLQNNSLFNSTIGTVSNIFNNYQTSISNDNSILTINFNQLQSSLLYNFNYYFNVNFSLI